MKLIHARYNPMHNSIDINHYNGYILRIAHPRGRYNADHILFEKVESARYYNNYRYNSFSVRCLKN